jgi:hypothetical protein
MNQASDSVSNNVPPVAESELNKSPQKSDDSKNRGFLLAMYAGATIILIMFITVVLALM